MSLFCNKTLRDSNKNLEYLFGGWKTYQACFVFTPSVGAVGICGVYVILILRAWQTSHKGQQNLIKLNAKASSIYVEVFLT